MTAAGGKGVCQVAHSIVRSAAGTCEAASPISRGRMKKQIFLVALGAAVLGCGSDSVGAVGANPDATSCSKGSISAGEVKTGTLNSASCRHYDAFYARDTIPFDSYSFKATKGKGYMFILDATDPASEWDAFLEMVTVNPNTGEEQLLAISDDEGGDREEAGGSVSRFYFVAPVSGTFYIRAAGLEMQDTSSYKLTAKSCDSPLGEIMDTLIASPQTLAASDCVLAEPEFVDDSSNVKLFSVYIGPNETKTVTVTSTDFPPAFQIYGPGWGVSCKYKYEGCGGGVAGINKSDTESFTITAEGDRSCNFDLLTRAPSGVRASSARPATNDCEFRNYPGQYTIAVGSFFGGLGSFTIAVSDGTPLPVRKVAPDGFSKNPTLQFLTRKPMRESAYLNRAH
jgi:hypothetical protein